MADQKQYEDGVRCAYEEPGAVTIPPEQLHPLATDRAVTGRVLDHRYAAALSQETTRLYLITVLHIAGRPSPTGGFEPIVDDDWVGTMFSAANDIWSQACIELVPYRTGVLVTDFRSLGVSAFAGLCLSPAQLELVEPYDVKTPDLIIVNVYVLDEVTVQGASGGCGSPVSGRIFLPTAGRIPERIGNTFAHELGHVLLNPAGVSDSENPDHLMFHASSHPDIPPGSRDGLFLSDCLAARTQASESLFTFARPGGFGALTSDREPEPCVMSPRLGNNLVTVVIDTDRVAVQP